MRINNLKINNLYGNNYYLKFNKDLTILHGVNGSGKTTILNIISDICRGNIVNVLRYEFDFLSMSIGNGKLIISLENDAYRIIFNEENIIIPKEVNKIIFNKMNSLDSIDMEKKYGSSRVHFHEELQYPEKIENLNRKIQKVFELTYISLDRNVYGLDVSKNKYWNIRHRKKNTEDRGIKRTLRMANEFYIDYEESILREERHVQYSLENSLLEKMAEPIGNVDFTLPIKGRIDITEMSTILLDKTSGKIRKNIEQLIDIYLNNKTRRVDIKPLDYGMSNPEGFIDLVNIMVSEKVAYSQLEKIYEVFKTNTKLRRRVENKKQKLKGTLEHINILLSDTQKKVMFKAEKGLYFKNLRTGQDLPLEHLSSGEIQLVIFMVFSLVKNQSNGELNKVLLIDEPELSLHISWQEKILPLMTKYREDSQMIIATHSPDIIGEMDDKCVEVKGYE